MDKNKPKRRENLPYIGWYESLDENVLGDEQTDGITAFAIAILWLLVLGAAAIHYVVYSIFQQ